jgi:hypothetical protein
MSVRGYSAVWALLWVVTLGFPMDVALLALSQTRLQGWLIWMGSELRQIGYLPEMDQRIGTG